MTTAHAVYRPAPPRTAPAAEMHKKYAPKPKETPMEVNAGLRDK